MRPIGNNKSFNLLHVAVLLVTAPVGAKEIPALQSMPEVGRIWMGMEEGTVRPASYQQIRSEAEGVLLLHHQHLEPLKRGAHWATVDPTQLELEEKTIALEERKSRIQLKKAEEDAEKSRNQSLLEIREIESKIEDLEDVAKSQEFSENMRKRSAKVLSELQERLNSVKESIEPATIEEKLQTEKEESELQIAQKRKQFELLRRRSMLTADNDGQLRLSEKLREKIQNAAVDNSQLWVKSGEHLATIVDDKRLEMVIPVAGPVMGQIPQEELAVFLMDGKSGQLIEGKFNRMEEVDSGVEISRSYIFDVAPESMEQAKQAMGQRHMVHVYRKFPHNHRLVHKKDIAFLAPQILETGGWHGLVVHLWPGADVIQVGPQTIAIDPPNAN